MNRLAMILSAALVFAVAGSASAGAQTPGPSEKGLAQYRDKNRVLLVFAPTAQDPAYLEQTKLWKNEKPGFDERQLVVVPVPADARGPEAANILALEKKYGVDAKAFDVVLLGKDGHDAYRSAKPLRADVLYAAIDAMPMRRAEMKQRPPLPAAPSPVPTPHKPDLDHDE